MRFSASSRVCRKKFKRTEAYGVSDQKRYPC